MYLYLNLYSRAEVLNHHYSLTGPCLVVRLENKLEISLQFDSEVSRDAWFQVDCSLFILVFLSVIIYRLIFSP